MRRWVPFVAEAVQIDFVSFFVFFLVKIFPRSRRFGERIGWKFGGRGKDERIVLSSKEVYFRAKLVKRVICMRV